MTLRFIQSLQPHQETLSREPIGITRPQAQPGGAQGPTRDQDLILLAEGRGKGGLLLGRPIVAPVYPADESTQAQERGARGPKPRTPAWLEGKFRPRNLTYEGQALLERMEPPIVLRDGPIDPVPSKDWGSIQERMDYLQRKYLLMDMVRRGFASESGGRFWPIVLDQYARRDQVRGPERRRNIEVDSLTPVLSYEDALGWVAAFREPTWDQLRALHPQRKHEVDRMIQQMMATGAVEEHRIAFGEGSITVLRMTPYGVHQFKDANENWKELFNRGLGPRKEGAFYGVYHEQAVGDAIGYFGHETQVLGGQVTGLLLDSGLRKLFHGHTHVPDLRVEYETPMGGAFWDVEVIGIGHSYQSTALRLGKSMAASTRGFDPLGRMSSRGGRDVMVKR